MTPARQKKGKGGKFPWFLRNQIVWSSVGQFLPKLVSAF